MTRSYHLQTRLTGLLLALVGLTASTHAEAGYRGIAISPDGTCLLAVYSNGASSFIYKVGVDTGKATRLTAAPGGYEGLPSFSADGKRIAYSFSPGPGTNSRIFIADADGSNAHPLANSGTNDFGALLSPDNRGVIFKRYGYYGNYSPIARPAQHEWNFYAADLNGNNVRQLTNESFYMVSPASLSPDGKTLLFVNSFDEIVLYPVDESSKPKIVLKPRLNGKQAEVYSEAVFSADGQSVLFTAAFDRSGKFNYNIYRLDLATKNVEALTSAKGHAGQLQVSRDGQKAVFVHEDYRQSPDTAAVMVLDLKTRNLTPLNITGLH
jgi:Tol biopolymer transport system component